MTSVWGGVRGCQAVNKKKSVSCPAGGRSYGQSGGRKFLFHLFYFLVGKYFKNEKKKLPSRPFLDTRPVHRKQILFLDWPQMDNSVSGLVRSFLPETLYHRDDALLYIAYVMPIWAAPIPADRWHCSLWP